MTDETHQLPVLVLVRDLMFSSKIRAEAQALNVPISIIRDPKALESAAGTRLIVDLNQPAVLDAAANWGHRTGNPVVGFVSHVDQPAITAARNAGIHVLPRSRFVEQLAELLR